MKKSLVALAALAVIGAASAQSTVTIGGQLDAGIASSKSAAGVTTTTQAGGISGASRLYFAGSEDMGGGNKANFRLEMQPNMANGAANTTFLFNRGAWMSLSGAWGEMRLGRQGTTAIGLICTADQLGCYSGFSGGGILFGGPNVATRWISANPNRGQSVGNAGLAQSTGGPGANGDYTRVINGVTYLSTNMSGFTGQVQYAFGGAASNQANGNGSSLGLNANYAQGPLFVGATYQTAAADATVNATGKQTTLGATYDLGMAKLGGAYQSESASGAVAYTSAKAWALTATFPMGAALPYVKVGQHKTNGVGAFGIVNGADSQVFNLGSYYSLSKRTRLYADYAVDNKGAPGKPTQLSAGIQHNF
jgi:predicted porin